MPGRQNKRLVINDITLQCHCNGFAVWLQQLCSATATGLQWHCKRLAVTLQKRCSDVAKEMQ